MGWWLGGRKALVSDPASVTLYICDLGIILSMALVSSSRNETEEKVPHRALTRLTQN